MIVKIMIVIVFCLSNPIPKPFLCDLICINRLWLLEYFSIILNRRCLRYNLHFPTRTVLEFQVDVFMDAAFDAVHVDIKFLSGKLSTLNNNVKTHEEKITKHICLQCEASLQFILSLCQQKIFRDRILSNKVLTHVVSLPGSSFSGKYEL